MVVNHGISGRFTGFRGDGIGIQTSCWSGYGRILRVTPKELRSRVVNANVCFARVVWNTAGQAVGVHALVWYFFKNLTPTLKCELQRTVRQSTRNTFHATRFTQHVSRNTLHAPRPKLQAPSSKLHAPSSTQHVPRNTLHATRLTFHASRSTHHYTSNPSITIIKRSGSIGFETYAEAPASRHFSLSPFIACAVTETIGKSLYSASLRMRRTVS